MEKAKSDQVVRLCTEIFGIADELRDYCIDKQNSAEEKKMMSLTVSQQRLSRAIWRMTLETPGGVSLKELADKLSLSSSAVSVMVESMVQKQMLVRATSPADRRMVLIKISALGRERMEECDKYFNELLGDVISSFGEEEYNKLLYKLCEIRGVLRDNSLNPTKREHK